MSGSAVDPITLQVRALEAMSLEELRAEWKARFGAPPRLRSTDLIRRIIAWRIQVDAWGGLDDETRRGLRETAVPRAGEALSLGAQITREWEGEVHRVQVVEGGFLHRGETHRSLSAIARRITGVGWNGPRFFGLRKAATGGRT